MDNHVKAMRTMAITAIILQALSMLIFCIAHLIPKPFLALVAPAVFREHTGSVIHPILFAAPLLQLIVVAAFGYMLLQECKKPTSFAPALMILILASAVVLRLIATALNWFSNFIIGRLYDAETIAIVSLLNSAISWTGSMTALVFPLLAAAAGINWCRNRNSLYNT